MKPDFRVMFFMGITFTGIGVVLGSSSGNSGLYSITVLGIIYMITGIANKDKWKNGAE